MTPDEVRIVENLTSHMTPRCVGRYLIDLPEKFVLNEISRTVIEGVTIEVTPMDKLKFESNFESQRIRYESMRLPLNGYPYLRSISPLKGGELGGVFDRNESDSTPMRAGRILELLAWRDGFLIRATIGAIDSGFPELQNEKYWRDRGTDVPDKLGRLVKVYERTRGRKDDEIPTEQGVCFANGFVKGPPTDQDWIDMYHHWEGVPDVYASFSYMSDIGKLGTSLLQRGKDIEKALSNENGKTLRKGARSTNGLEFEEWLYQTQPEPKEPMLFDMTAEMNSKGGNAQHPLLVFGLVSGDKHPRPSPTLEQAALEKPLEKVTLNAAQTVALWDKISATLRKRPGAF